MSGVCNIALVALLCTVLFVSVQAYNVGTACLNGEVGSIDQQDRVCDLDSPYCIYYSNGFAKRCAECKVLVGNLGEQTRGGSCSCDARVEFCSQSSDATSGLCVPYTTLGAVCTNDVQCQTTTTRVSPQGNPTTVTNQRLFCVNGFCKPCKPSVWATDVGTVGVANVTCPGYDATLSTTLQRYAMRSRLPGSAYTCTSAGDIMWLDGGDTATSDYDYGYSCGNRALWPQDCAASPSPSPQPSTGVSQSAEPDGAAALIVQMAAVVCVCGALLMI